MIENNCYFQILDMHLDDSLELIYEVIENRTERRIYDYYLSTLIFSLFSKEKPESYAQFKRKILKPKKVITKMTEEEKNSLIEKNNNLLKSLKVGE